MATAPEPDLTYSQPEFHVKLKTSRENNPTANFDNEWLKSTFVISDTPADGDVDSNYLNFIKRNRYMSTASHKFASTSPGMSLGVNPKPQFTRYCDIRDRGRVTSRDLHVSVGRGSTDEAMMARTHKFGLGLGGYYSDAFDDTQQRIFFRFGVPSYMPLPIWIAKAFDIDKAVLQGRGTITSNFLGAVSLVASFLAFVAAPALFIGMTLLSAISSSLRFFSVRSTMYTYWATVETIMNSMVARRTMLGSIGQEYSYKLTTSIGTPPRVDAKFLASIHSYIPDLVNGETGRVSIFALALRGQTVYNRIKHAEMRADEAAGRSGAGATMETGIENITSNVAFTPVNSKGGSWTNSLFMTASKLLMSGNNEEPVSKEATENPATTGVIRYSPEFTDPDGAQTNISLDPNVPEDNVDKRIATNAAAKAGWFSKYSEYLLAELSDGAAFAIFNVEATGSVGESFSSGFGSNPIESTFNSFSAKARNLGSLLNGLKDIPLVGSAVELAADSMAVVLSKSTNGLVNPLLALAYGVNVSMPKVWESSSASMPKSNYKIKLVSPYGNAYSQLFNIYMPLAMLLAGSLPRSTGASSYNSPFFCELYDKGRSNIQVGMISNLSITRGTSNLAFTKAGHPNAIDVDISVDNLDEIVSVDVTASGVISKYVQELKNAVNADTPFVGYMNTIAAVDVYTLAFQMPRLRLKMAESYMNLKSIVNPDPAAFAFMTVGNMPFSSLLKLATRDSAAALQDLNTF